MPGAPLILRNMGGASRRKGFATMYLPSNTPLMQDQRVSRVNSELQSEGRRQNATMTAVAGRAALFNTLVSPDVLAAQFGPGLGTSASINDSRSVVARASALMTGTPTENAPTFAQIVADAPVVGSGPGCRGPVYARNPLGPNPTPGMPKRAPTIVNGPYGVMHFDSGPSSLDPAYGPGLTGYAPPWSDAFVGDSGSGGSGFDMGVVGWIQSHPWLSLAIAAGGVFAASRGRR